MLNLNIDPQAYHIADLVVENLSQLNLDYPSTSIKTYAWYNGRERGVSLVVSCQESNISYIIVVANERRSDYIAIDKYYVTWPGHFPHHTDSQYKEAYENRYTVATVEEAVEWINRFLEDYF